jgi:hypothetical protein
VYLEGGKPEPATTLSPAQQPTPAVASAVIEQTPRQPAIAPSPCESNELSEDQEFYGPGLRNAAGNGVRNGELQAAARPTQAAPVSEFPTDREIFKILTEFINPPESAPAANHENTGRLPARMSAYGMGSAAVAGGFGAGASSSPVPGSSGGKAFPTLPWDYFYKPAPVDSALRNSATNGAGTAWGASGSGFPRPTSSGNAGQRVDETINGNPLAQIHQRHGSQGQSRLVENQADALRSLDLGADHVSQQPQGYSARGVWSNTPAESSSTARGVASNPLQQSPWAPSSNPWQNTYGQNTTAASGVPNSPFSTFNFSANSSSLPQVNSPWGLPTTAQRFPPTQSPVSPNHPGGYPSGSVPSPLGSRYASDYATAMADGHSQAYANGWSGARHARTGSSQLNIWGNAVVRQAAADGRADGKTVMQGMPKR